MKMFIVAAALAVAIPAAAHAADAQPNAPATPQAAASKHDHHCCDEMMKDRRDHQRMHHDMSGHQRHGMSGHQPPQG